MRIRTMVILAASLSGCGRAPNPEAQPVKATAPVVTATTALSEADLLRVCKGGAAFRNGREVKGIKAAVVEGPMVRLSYVRDDGKAFSYDCMAEGDVLRLRMIDEAGPGTGPGTWSGRGSKTTFKILEDEIEFTDDFFDGSAETKRIRV